MPDNASGVKGWSKNSVSTIALFAALKLIRLYGWSLDLVCWCPSNLIIEVLSDQQPFKKAYNSNIGIGNPISLIFPERPVQPRRDKVEEKPNGSNNCLI